MSLILADIARLRSKWDNPKLVGILPDAIVRALGWKCHNVYLSSKTLEHINKDHSDVSDFDLLHIPLALRFGLIVAEKSAPNRILISYQPRNEPRRYKCALKATSGATEIWVSTFHRMKARQTRAMLKRGTVLRRHRVWW